MLVVDYSITSNVLNEDISPRSAAGRWVGVAVVDSRMNIFAFVVVWKANCISLALLSNLDNFWVLRNYMEDSPAIGLVQRVKLLGLGPKEVSGWMPDFEEDIDQDKGEECLEDVADTIFEKEQALLRNCVDAQKNASKVLDLEGDKLGHKVQDVVQESVNVREWAANVRNDNDERHGSIFNAHGADAFNLFISSAGLEEVPLDGCKFTWCYKSGSKMSKYLDRFSLFLKVFKFHSRLLQGVPLGSSLFLMIMRESHILDAIVWWDEGLFRGIKVRAIFSIMSYYSKFQSKVLLNMESIRCLFFIGIEHTRKMPQYGLME
ncbi:hypothetical protein Tco_0010464 [Tanacetum coccineum]